MSFIKNLLAQVKSVIKNPLALIDKGVSLLPKPLQQVAKSIVAAVVPLVSVSLLNGSLNYKAIIAAALSAVVVYLTPNKPAAAPK